MERNKFKVGDRVVTTCGVFAVEKGMVGTVVDFDCFAGRVLVKFDGWHNGHDGRGDTASGKRYEGNACYYISDKFLKKFNETIVLYRKDNRVIAFDKSTGEKAETICSPEDTFDFRIGARLAFQRLMGEPEEEPVPMPFKYNGKVIFTKGDGTFKTGHIYEVKDGKIFISSDGIGIPSDRDDFLSSIDDIKEFFDGRARKRSSWNAFKHLELIEVLED